MDLLADKLDASVHETLDRVAALERRLDKHGHGVYQGVWKAAPHMTPRGRSHERPADIDALLALMDPWPQSWAGDEEDEPIGRNFVATMRLLMTRLHDEKLSPRTLRRHIDNLWLIGGEIVRRLNDEPTLRATPPTQLLLDAVAAGEAPWVDDLTEADQAALDATARKLLHFLTSKT